MFGIRDQCDRARMHEFLAGRLPADDQLMLVSHLDGCSACREWLESSAAVESWWTEAGTHLRDDPLDTAAGDRVVCDLAGPMLPPGERLDLLRITDYLDPTDDPRMLGRFGGYEITGIIGCGGMGVVLKGFEPALDRYVAVKVLAPHLATSGAARTRFAREARAAAAVLHENVVAIHRVDEASGLPFLVMPHIPGDSLQKRLDRRGPLDVPEILRIGMQVAAGLAAAHAQGLVHRDIKPGNILLDNGVERVTITDFGLARAADDASLTRSGVITGTPQYMSPEQARGEPVDGRSDLFSLGSVLYAMCTGRAPFRSETPFGVLRRISESSPRPIREIAPETPEWLCEIIAKLHARSPEERFQTASDVEELLGRWLAHLQHPAVNTRPPRVRTGGGFTSRFLRRWPVWSVIAVAAVAAIGMLPVLILQPQSAARAFGDSTTSSVAAAQALFATAPPHREPYHTIRTDAELAAEADQIHRRMLELEEAWSVGSDSASRTWHAELSELERRTFELADQINRNSP